MKTKIIFPVIFVSSFIINGFFSSSEIPSGNSAIPGIFIRQQIRFDPNNIDTWIWNTGVFDQDLRTNNTPGFQWPKGTGKFAVFTAGLTTGALVNGQIRLASASYLGEYTAGYIADSAGHPVPRTDSTFKFYKVSAGDNMYNNPDWLNWGLMVPFGAPFVDANHNGIYEPAVDTPGIRGAYQTVFVCLTDGFPETHIISEGFGGGTPPLFAELRITAWGYNNPGYEDMIFRKFVLINKNDTSWNSAYTAIVSDTDLGDSNDDYIGCDSSRNLGFCYNADNVDGTGSGISYGVNPPAVGFKWLLCSGVTNIGLTSFTYFTNTGSGGPICENDPTNAEQAYNFLKGVKRDGTPWVLPPGGTPQHIRKFIYTGDPETGTGWNEGYPGTPSGSVQNCGGPNILHGLLYTVNPPGDRRIIMSSGSETNNIAPGDTVKLMIAQLIARGTNNKNSVTKLRLLSDVAQNLCNNGFIIGVTNISSEIPNSYELYQNYPNPFNPVTKIRFDIPSSKGARGMITKLVVYDILGREIKVLVNEGLFPGTYEVDWDASNYPSGVYFYKLITEDFTEARKMVLIK